MGRIVITGATGTVGSELVMQLTAQGADLQLAVRQPSQIKGVKAIVFDYTDPDTFKGALEGCQKLLLIVPPSSQSLDAIEELLEVAHHLGVEHVVAITGMGAESLPDAATGKIDLGVRQGVIPWTILRPNWFMQNFYTYFRDDVARGEILLPAADSKTSFIDVRDIAEAAVVTLLSKKYRYDALTLTGCESLTHHNVAEIFSHHLERSIVYRPADDEEYGLYLKEQNWPEGSIREMLQLFEDVRAGGFSPVHEDIEKLLGRPASRFPKFVLDHSSRWS